MLRDYRSEKWFTILTNLLKRTIECALYTGNIEDFITYSIEILSTSISVDEQYKLLCYKYLLNVLSVSIIIIFYNRQDRKSYQRLLLVIQERVCTKLSTNKKCCIQRCHLPVKTTIFFIATPLKLFRIKIYYIIIDFLLIL